MNHLLEREFDASLIREIMGGLRPSIPDSAPDEYRKLAERCCDADPDKRPVASTIWSNINELIEKVKKENDNTWNAIYYNDVKPLSRLEKESKYSSTLVPTGHLPKPGNSYDSQLPPLSDFNLSSLEVELEEIDKK